MKTLNDSRQEIVYNNCRLFCGKVVYPEEVIKKLIKLLKEEFNDFKDDVIALTEIHNYGKEDLIIKMRILCKAHKMEINKLLK